MAEKTKAAHERRYTEIDREICVQRVPDLSGCRILTAIGDSITEGYSGKMYVDPILCPDDAPPGSISRDGRNFPTPGPTTTIHAGGQKFMASCMPELNDLLSDRLGPVFINNEGVANNTSTADYLQLMTSNREWFVEGKLSPRAWRARQKALKPDSWLILLGHNDARRQATGMMTTDEFEDNLRTLLGVLVETYQASAKRMWVALPCYFRDPSGELAAILLEYSTRIRRLWDEGLASAGPDFFSFFRDNRERCCCDDVHPNALGMTEMARLWAKAILDNCDNVQQKNVRRK